MEQKNVNRKKKGFSVFTLKIVATILLMLQIIVPAIAQSAYAGDIRDNFSVLSIVVVSQIISWAAVPMYAWMLVEGIKHTEHIGLYALRLAVLAIICEIPYDYATSQTWFNWRSQNPVFGLLIALITVIILRKYKRNLLVSVIAIIAGLLWNLFGFVGVMQGVMYTGVLTFAMVLIFWFLYDKENTKMITAGLLGAMFFIAPGVGVAVLHYVRDEEPIKSQSLRRMFYVLYPVILISGMIIALL
ncbi:MAG: TraX family protein [Bifidobacteriaceae bacterium]|nr:TraX family protein [Bifidobacteriaceae bacterium]